MPESAAGLANKASVKRKGTGSKSSFIFATRHADSAMAAMGPSQQMRQTQNPQVGLSPLVDGPHQMGGPDLLVDGPNLLAVGPNPLGDGLNLRAGGPNLLAGGPNHQGGLQLDSQQLHQQRNPTPSPQLNQQRNPTHSPLMNHQFLLRRHQTQRYYPSMSLSS